MFHWIDLNIVLIVMGLLLGLGSYYAVSKDIISSKRYYTYMAIELLVIVTCIKPIV
ncbi:MULTISPECIES: hypothetical protein [unclassified Psychrobacillus]|uniref:hypothetical protein n=1 Tax=unclassified Psychrobacillus TaxID=2636677 RepID=UPI0030F4E108